MSFESRFNDTRYTPIEKSCMSSFYACTKFEYSLSLKEMMVLCKTYVVTYLLNRYVL